MIELDFSSIPTIVGVSIACLIVISLIFVLSMDARIVDMNGKRLPGPRSNFFGKTFVSVMQKARQMKQASKVIKEVWLDGVGNGNIFGVDLFWRKVVIIAHPDMVKTVLSGSHVNFPKADRYSRLKFALGNGLVTAEGSIWHAHRQVVAPSFHAEELKRYFKVFSNITNKTVDKWITLCRDHPSVNVDLNSVLVDITLRVICQSAFGYQFKNDEVGASIMEDFSYLLDEINSRISHSFDWWHKLDFARSRSTASALKNIQSVIDSIVEKRMTSSNPNEKKDLLGTLIAASAGEKNPMTAEDIRHHLLTFFAAGHETTSSTLLWVFFEICQNREIMDRCVAEVDSVFKLKENDDVTYEDYEKLVYLQQVVREALRLHPPVPGLARTNNVEVQFDDYKLAPGHMIFVSILAVHRHPDFWVNPEKFDPDRFAPNVIRETLRHPFQYLPFSGGPRNCIGQRFALMESVAVLALLLKSFEISMSAGDIYCVSQEETVTFQPKRVRVNIFRRV